MVAGAGFLLVFHRLDVSAWFDEAYSYGMATMPFNQFLTQWAWGSESNMLLYYLALRDWLWVAGALGAAPTEIVLRIPSAIFAVAADVVVFVIGRRLFGRLGGGVAAALYAANFLQMILAQNARAYSLELLLLGLSWLTLFIALEENRARWWVAYGAMTVLSVYASLFSGLVIVSQVAGLGALLVIPGPWQARVRKAIRPIAVSLAVSFALVAPVVADAYLHGGPVWVPPAHLDDLKAFFFFLSGDSHLYEYLVVGAAALAVVLAGAAQIKSLRRWTNADSSHLGVAVALLCWFAGPILISFALTRPGLNLHLFFSRYLVVVIPPLCLLAGLAVSALPVRGAQAVAAAGLLLVAWPPLNFYYQLAQVQDFKGPVSWLEARYQQGDGVVCDPAIQCSIPIAYYFETRSGPAALNADSPGVFDWSTNSSIPVSDQTVAQYTAKHHRIFLVYAPLGHGNSSDAEAARVENALTADGYRVIDQTFAPAAGADTTVLLFESTS